MSNNIITLPGNIYIDQVEGISEKEEVIATALTELDQRINSIPDPVKPDWNATPGSTAEILNKPTNISSFNNDSGYALLNSPTFIGTPTAPTAAASTNSTLIATTAFVKTAVSGKQDTISDLVTIRSGATAGATAYQKPSEGIPKSDLSIAVQTSLGKADTALQSHQDISGKVDKVTSTDNAVVRFDGTSGAVQNSGVTIDDSNNITAAKFVTKNGTTSQVVRGDGSLATSKELPQYEAYLEWGGKNFTASYGPIDAAMVSDLGANRLQFLKAAGITIEYSRDNGTTWQEYPADDSSKVALFSTYAGFIIGKGSNGSSSADYQLRVTINSLDGGIYSTLNKFVIFVGTNGSEGCYCTISARTQGNFVNNIDTWKTISDQIPISGWTGYNIINIPDIATCGNTTNTSQYRQVRFTFGCTKYQQSATRSGLTIQRIMGFGGVGWMCPSTMAKTGHLYSFDYNQNATFPALITATAFKKTNGTSSLFLKADGSVDINIYLTQSTFNSLNPDLKAIEELTDTSGFLKKTAANTWTLDTNTYLTEHQSLENYATKSYVNGKIVDNTTANDQHSVAMSMYASYAEFALKSQLATVATSGSYTDLLNKPTNISSFNNDSGYALLNSPTFIGTPTAPTQTSGDNSTKIATTAFVQGEISTQLGNIETLLQLI